MSKPRQVGFTLIELMTVVAILGLLAAVLLPSILTVMQANWRAKCGNHLKVLAETSTHYATTFNRFYPDWSTTTWKAWLTRQGLSEDMLYCPAKNRGRIDSSQAFKEETPESDFDIEIGQKYLRVDQVNNNDIIASDKDGNHRQQIGSGQTIGWNKLHPDGRVVWHAKTEE